MKKWVGWVLLGACLVVAYQGYGNAQPDAATEALAKDAVCSGATPCERKSERPREIRADAFGRRYGWDTKEGPVRVACRREWFFFGTWSCVATPGKLDDPA